MCPRLLRYRRCARFVWLFSSACLLIFLLLSCNGDKHENPMAPLPTDHNPITMTIGDSWLFQRMFINISDSGTVDSGTFDFPDTIIGYSYFSATKDTVIDGTSYLIIDGRDYDVEKDTISIFKKRFALHLGDTVKMYEFNTGTWGFLSGLMKRQAGAFSIPLSHYGTSSLKKLVLNKLLAATDYDTSVFYDFVYPMVFPLIKDSAYVYRDTGDPRGNLYFRRRFLGVETVSLELGQFQAYKYEFCTKEAFGIDSIFFYDWIGLNGLLKRYIDTGTSDITDSLGNTIARIRYYDIAELIGRTDIHPDTLTPWGK